jgi:hypothetical protein
MISRQGALLLRHVALMGEQVVLADFVGFGDGMRYQSYANIHFVELSFIVGGVVELSHLIYKSVLPPPMCTPASDFEF